MSEPIGNTEQLAEPVACRYDFDGYGYIYMDAGSGSDWASRVKNCEFLYTHPQRELTNEEIDELMELFHYFDDSGFHFDHSLWICKINTKKGTRMKAIELADELDKLWDKSFRNPTVSKSADMLRQQDKEIEQLKLNLRLVMLDNSSLRKELEDCTCQGGHSEAYLKVKGKK